MISDGRFGPNSRQEGRWWLDAVLGSATRAGLCGRAGLCLLGREGHLELGDAGVGVGVIPVVVELSTSAGGVVAGVLDPLNERLVDRADVVHRPAMDNRRDLDAGKVDHADALAVGDLLV